MMCIFERWLLVERSDFIRVVLQLAHGSSDLDLKIGLVDDRHTANRVGLEMFLDELIWIAIGRIRSMIVQALDQSSGFLGNVSGPAINDQEDWPLGTSHHALMKTRKVVAQGALRQTRKPSASPTSLPIPKEIWLDSPCMKPVFRRNY